MPSQISKNCSIGQYIRGADIKLYELIANELCQGGLFYVKKNMVGLTFLRPDESLYKELMSLLTNDDTYEKGVETVQSLFILDALHNPSDFNDKKEDIPNYLRKKLLVDKVDGNKVILKNGGVLELDKKYKPKDGNDNTAVYILSKQLVELDTPPTEFSNTKTLKKSVKGGAELNNNRSQLFENILNGYYNTEQTMHDCAMEFIVSMHYYVSKMSENTTNNTTNITLLNPEEAKNIKELIESQVSYDTITSLAIILQPYKDIKTYINNEQFGKIIQGINGTVGDQLNKFKLSPVYTYVKNPCKYYENLVETCKFSEVSNKIKKICSELSSKLTKINPSNTINLMLGEIKRIVKDNTSVLGKLRCDSPMSLLFAESELRIVSAIVQENQVMEPEEVSEIISMFNQHNLNQVYYLTDKEMVANCGKAFFYSVSKAITMSDAIFHLPNYEGKNKKYILTDNFISYSLSFKESSLHQKLRSNSDVLVGNYHKEILDMAQLIHQQQ
jgi:hypothetical protein